MLLTGAHETPIDGDSASASHSVSSLGLGGFLAPGRMPECYGHGRDVNEILEELHDAMIINPRRVQSSWAIPLEYLCLCPLI